MATAESVESAKAVEAVESAKAVPSVVIYLVCEGKEEAAEIFAHDTTEDVINLFRTAAEAGPDDILKLYTSTGKLICISANLKANTEETRYVLRVTPKVINPERLLTLVPAAEADIARIVQKLSFLEQAITDSAVAERLPVLQQNLRTLTERIAGLNYLSWVGLTEEGIPQGRNRVMGFPFWWKPSQERTVIYRKRIQDLFMALTKVPISKEVLEDLRTPDFDNWQWTDAHMLVHIREMYIDLGLVKKFNIELEVLENWLYKVYMSYNIVPFHNFRHCFSVTQMMYSLIWTLDLKSKLEELDMFILLTAAVSHDIDHPGYNNLYQESAKTDLFRKYPESTLENYHLKVALDILENDEYNIKKNLNDEEDQTFKDLMTRIILATDLAKSNALLESLRLIEDFDIQNKDHKYLAMIALVKISDISNEARKLHISGPWLDCLLQEFFCQNEVEKMEGLRTFDFMDRDKVTKPSAQVPFIKNTLLPLLEAVNKFFPAIEEILIQTAKENMAYYTNLEKEIEEAKLNISSDDKKSDDNDDKNICTPQEETLAQATDLPQATQDLPQATQDLPQATSQK